MSANDSGHSAATVAPAETRPERYDLFLREDFSGGLVWRYEDNGIAVEKDGLRWRHAGEERHALYADIRTIRLQTGHIPRSGFFGSCTIGFRNGRNLLVTSLNSWGVADGERDDAYPDFVRDFHAHLSAEDRKRIAFLAGNTEARHRFGWFALILAGAFFVLLPIVLLLITGESKALFLTAAGVVFVYPVWKTVQKNEPRSYRPDNLDADLFP